MLVVLVVPVVEERRDGAVGVICETVEVWPATYTVVDVAGPANATPGVARTALIQAMAAANLSEFTSREL